MMYREVPLYLLEVPGQQEVKHSAVSLRESNTLSWHTGGSATLNPAPATTARVSNILHTSGGVHAVWTSGDPANEGH